MKKINELLPDIKLRFNIEHPSLEECYLYGYECALAEIDEGENPFHSETQEYNYWQDGWWAGFYGDKPLFEAVPDSESSGSSVEEMPAANDQVYPFIHSLISSQFLANMLKITGALAATAIVGYQVFELVA